MASFDDETMQWTITRTNDEKKGNKLSNGGKGSDCLTVRFTVPFKSLGSMCLAAHTSGYDCIMTSSTSEGATFKMQ